jgi:VanZ family protein
MIMLRRLSWLLLAAIFALSVVPAAVRPVVAPQTIEHAAAFAIAGVLFVFAHELTFIRGAAVAVAYSGLIELVQLFVPGRHARLSDFLIDALAALIGSALGHHLRQVIWPAVAIASKRSDSRM